MGEGDLKVGDMFVYMSPSGREIVYTVDALAARTPQGEVMPRARRADGYAVYLHDELLAQEWWQPLGLGGGAGENKEDG